MLIGPPTNTCRDLRQEPFFRSSITSSYLIDSVLNTTALTDTDMD